MIQATGYVVVCEGCQTTAPWNGLLFNTPPKGWVIVRVDSYQAEFCSWECCETKKAANPRYLGANVLRGKK